MSDYEKCRTNLARLSEWYNVNKENRNEATTRLHLIDTLFFDCLGWRRKDVIAEEHFNGEYADYTFSAPRKALIVEAKKRGRLFRTACWKSKKSILY